MTRVRAAFAAACALAVLATACTKVDTGAIAANGRHPWTKPGVLRIAAAADPKTLDPVTASAEPTLELSAFIFSYTVRYNDKAQPVADAVREIPTIENGDVSRDGLTLKYKLRPNMKWHDGQPVTCRDLRFTWQVMINPHNNVNTTDGWKLIRDVDCSDPLVAIVNMKHIYAPFLQQLWSVNGNAPILPEHLLAKYNDNLGSFNHSPFESAPVGSGPFKFVSWVRGSEIRLVANPDFYLRKPKLNEVIYKIIADDNTLATQIETHEIDMLFHGNGSQWARIRAIPGTTAITPSTFSYTHLDFNFRRPVFRDLRVREALEDALDRPAMLQKLQHGLGELAETDQSPTLSWAYTPDVVHHPFDVAKARALLDAAGWHVGRDGIRIKNGQRFSFTISTQAESAIGRAIEDDTQRYWHDVGAEVSVKNAPTSLFFDNSANGILQGGKYDVATFTWSAAADPDDAPLYADDNFAPHGQNSLFWVDKPATGAMHDALLTVDQSRRKADYRIVQQRLASQVPTIILWFLHEPQVYNDDLKHFTATPVITTPFWNTWEYEI